MRTIPRTTLRPLTRKSALSESALHVINSLVDLAPDVTRDRRALVTVCKDGFEVNEALEKLSRWRALFGGAN